MRRCPTNGGYIHVLYVDDNPDLLVIGKTFMEADSRLDVDTCPNAQDALDIISLGGYDVIVSDYQMPGMDGIEFLKELRRRGDDTPFIIFTGKGREEVVMEAYENGAHYYTQKGTDFAPQFIDLRNKIIRSYESVRDKRDLERLRAAVQCSVDGIALFDGKGQHLFTNKAYLRIFGYENQDELCDKTLSILYGGDDHDHFHRSVESALRRDGNFLTIAKGRKKDGTVFNVETSYTLLGDDLCIMIARDITDLMKARKEAETLAELQRMLMTVTSRFVGVSREEADAAIDISLADLGGFTGADRVYIFDYDFDNGSCDNTYEWCAEGIPPEKDNLQNVPISGITEWVGAHSRGEHILIPDVTSHHEESTKEILMPQGILSLLTIPMMCGDSCKGFIGFDSVRSHRDFNDTEISLLRLFSDAILSLRLRLDGE